MTTEELQGIRERVRVVGDRIQPLLQPAAGLSKRNAPAHLWLGIRLIFGDEWRVRADPASVRRFIDWIDQHPNDDYDAWPERPVFRPGTFSERLF